MAIGVGAGIAIMAGAQVLTGLMAAHQQKQGQKGAQNELDRIRKAFDALVPPQYDIDIEDPPDLVFERIDPADYDFSKLTPELFEVVGTYTPEIAPYVAEQAPQLVEDTAAGREGLFAQQQALDRFRDIAAGGIDPQFAQRMKEAEDAAQRSAQSRSQSILQDYQRRGLLGSGTGLAAELAGAEGAMERQADLSADAATQAYLNQLDALRTSADLGGRIRGTELDLASRNVDIANAFNQRTSQAFQNYLQQAANARNEAELRNLAASQGVSDANVQAAIDAQYYDRDREDRLKTAVRDQQIGEQERENVTRRQGWLDKIQEKGISDALKQQMFDNELRKTQGSVGGAIPAAQNIRHGAQIDANVIGGIGKAATQGAMTAMEMEQRKKDRELYKDIWG